MVDPGDEVIIFDPYFVMYRHLVTLAGGTSVLVDTYPDFRIDAAQGRGRDHPAHQVRPGQHPGQPDRRGRHGRGDASTCRALPAPRHPLDQRRGLPGLLLRRPFATPATWNEDVLVVDGFSKAHGMTGWRLGFAHGPAGLIQEMAKLQQFSFVCAPSMVQYGGVAALDEDLTAARRRLPPQARHGGRGPRGRFELPVPKAPSTPFRALPGAPPPNSSPRRSAATS